MTERPLNEGERAIFGELYKASQHPRYVIAQSSEELAESLAPAETKDPGRWAGSRLRELEARELVRMTNKHPISFPFFWVTTPEGEKFGKENGYEA
jgi:hypothetical protein